jgi:tetrahydromethanopterin S-methyltransferase subunit H
MDYGRDSIVRDDWRKIFDQSELDAVIAKMLHLEPAAG